MTTADIQKVEQALRHYIGATIVVTPAPARKQTRQVIGVLADVTSAGYTVQGAHYKKWFAHQDVFLGLDTVAGACAGAVERAIKAGQPALQSHG